jgi:PTH1 family peptidyl-tRNA hydrolase
MKLIVGLGNPGKKYEKTRHNMGFISIDLFAEKAKLDFDKEGFNGEYAKGKIFDDDVILLKPSTFMNLSGESVFSLASYFKISIEDIVVIYDDMALAPGSIRLREKGTSGGQKGMQNIIDIFKTDEIKRIRIGTGEPNIDTIDYVLSKPTKEELILIQNAIELSSEALFAILEHGFHYAMSKYNKKEKHI